MKKILKTLGFLAFTIVFQQCTSQAVMTPAQLETLVTSNEFTFEAEKANPSAGDALNMINNMPNSSGSRILNLQSGYYSMIVKPNLLDVALPYYGRIFSGNTYTDPNQNSLRFTSKNYDLFTKKLNKKTVIHLRPTDIPNVKELILEIFANGKATLSVDSKDRQPISYDGYIAPIKEKEKKN